MFRKQPEKIKPLLKNSNTESKLEKNNNILLISSSTHSHVKKQICELLDGTDYKNTIGLSCHSFQSPKQKISIWESAGYGRMKQIVINSKQNIGTLLICDDSLEDTISSIKKLNLSNCKQNCWVVTNQFNIRKVVEEDYGISVIEIPNAKNKHKFFLRVTEKQTISEKSHNKKLQ